jgi:hypothetical protein
MLKPIIQIWQAETLWPWPIEQRNDSTKSDDIKKHVLKEWMSKELNNDELLKTIWEHKKRKTVIVEHHLVMHSNVEEPKLFEIAFLFVFYFLLLELVNWLLCILNSNTLLLPPHIVKHC